MKLSDGLFLESCRTVAAEYEGRIEFEDRIVDNMCMQLVQKPELYDVLVLPNLYGDIVSDLAAGLVGGLGVAPGANIGTEAAVFEPVHGSAPKYAGLDKANPTALILSGALMLRHLGDPDAADAGRDAPCARSSRRAADDLRPRRRRPARPRFADAVIARLGATAGDRPMTGAAGRASRRSPPPSRPAPRRRASAHDPAGDRWWVAPGVQGTLFTICATTCSSAALVWTPLFGTAYEVDGYLSPLFSPLIAPAWLPRGFSPGS